VFEKQGWHLLFLTLLLVAVAILTRGDMLSGRLWGISTKIWLWIAITVPVIHQVIVWFFWRAELHHGLITHWFGNNDFTIFRWLFTILFVARAVTLILLGTSNYGTLSLSLVLAYVLAGVLFIPFVYTMYSVVRYFGINRAYGIDHFDPSYRDRPFVKQGMFKYTDNAMYTFGFLILWSIALVYLSQAALIVAAFNHLYIWVHFYFTELPDIRRIYARN